jgi:hypothetical protein
MCSTAGSRLEWSGVDRWLGAGAVLLLTVKAAPARLLQVDPGGGRIGAWRVL